METESGVPPPAPREKFAPEEAAPVREPQFWEIRYKNKDTGWDLGAAAPPLAEFFTKNNSSRPPARVLVPGCGRGHDALFLAKLGFDVVAVDFTNQALAALRHLRRNLWIPPEKCKTARADVLHLPARFHASFDLIVEETCFCAIDPTLRDLYVAMARDVLVPGGRIVALLYPFREGTEGPPFPMTEREVESRFGRDFEIEHCEIPGNSVEKRRGEERLFVMRRRGEPVVKA